MRFRKADSKFTPDKETLCLRLEQGIPPELAQVIPAEMDIIAIGTSFETGHPQPMYNISEVLACGTAEDIIEYMIDAERLFGLTFDLDFSITKVREGVGSSLYVLRQPFYGGTVGEIMEQLDDDFG